jgi:hypothetical protein
MRTPSEGIQTTYDRIHVDWQALESFYETGGTFSIVSYELQMSPQSDDQWQSIVGGSSAYTLLSYVQAGLITGTDYKFRIRASNSFGWGEFSDEVTIRADEVPA